MKICVVGAGYVGLSLATMLSVKNEVCIVDVVGEKVKMINVRKSPIRDEYIDKYFGEYNLNLTATTCLNEGVSGADFCIIATPTNYDPETKKMDVGSVDSVIEGILRINADTNIVIKSTVPVGYTASIRKRKNSNRIFFSPEFLRETKALYDNLYPSRIIVGADVSDKEQLSFAEKFVCTMIEASLSDNVEYRIISTTEAEAVKLFANTYLAMRVSYFNELDTFAATYGLDPKMIIEGVCLDSRIGMHYNNPSFGYGGYCFPKDTKQLLYEYSGINQNLIGAVVDSNTTRINFIVEQVDKLLKEKGKKKSVVGIYKLAMKSNSDNYRNSAAVEVMKGLKEKGYEICIYDPILSNIKVFLNNKVLDDLSLFKKKSDIILANRVDECLQDVFDKVYSRDCYNRD